MAKKNIFVGLVFSFAAALSGTMEWDNSLFELGVSSVSVSQEAIVRSETVYPMYSCPVFLS